MDKANIAAVLAVGAAFFIAVGDVMHQRTARGDRRRRRPPGVVPALLRDRTWWLGSLVAAAGQGLVPDDHATAALARGEAAVTGAAQPVSQGAD